MGEVRTKPETVAHWPGGQRPMEGTRPASLWAELEKEVMDLKCLGPRPCFAFKPYKEDYRLRYYPLFQSLVFQGQMTDQDKSILETLSSEETWQTAIRDLHKESRRTIQISDSEAIPIDQSIRGKIPGMQKNPDQYINVDKNLKTRLVYSAMDTICRLVHRDELEAKRRYQRWENRSKYGWDTLEAPHPVGHILAFFPTGTTLEDCEEILKKKLPDLPGNNRIFLYYRHQSEDEKKKILEKTPAESMFRKIILATNLAETSLTVEDLVYVVDTGLILQTFYNPEIKSLDYPTILHSQAGCRQRLGRVGRKEPGEGYRLYTREELKAHPEFTTPEVTRSDPAQLVLNLVSAGLSPSFIYGQGALMQPPKKEWVDATLANLRRMDAIDEDGDLTSRGAELMQIPQKDLGTAVLLCEADRFGCLWEMAVFLCFTGLNDRTGPVNQSKWLTLWVPDGRKVFEDDLEEKLDDFFEEVPIDADETIPAASAVDSIWANPYKLGSVLIKQQALRRGCLDDLELYLRIWQGWYGQDDNLQKRFEWAVDHGVSAEALMRVENALGLDPKDTSRTGMLRHFWDFQQKGIMKRDIHFDALDKVRYLYAAANHDALFSISETGEINSCDPADPGAKPQKEMTIKLSPESLWKHPDLSHPLRFDKSTDLSCLAATILNKTRGTKRHKVLRHIVWLSPDWIKDGMPNLYDNPVYLAKRFSQFSDDYQNHYGQRPFASGDQLSGLPWPMPGFPVPSSLQIRQWHIRYTSGIRARIPYPAIVQHRITWIENIKQIAFVQLIAGPLLPMILKKPWPSMGEEIMVTLTYDDTSECLWAVRSQIRPSSPPPEGNARESVKTIQQIIPIPRPVPVDFQKQLPANTITSASFIHYSPSDKGLWVTVAVHIPNHGAKQWAFPVYKENEKETFMGVEPGKQCRIRIKEWVFKNNQPTPLITFLGWI